LDHLTALEFDKILNMLSECAVSAVVRERCLRLTPSADLNEAARWIGETTQSKVIIEHVGTPPLANMAELQKIIGLLGIDVMLSPDQITNVSSFMASCRRMKDYLKKSESTGVDIAFYGGSIVDLAETEDELNRCIRGDQVDDRASQRLYDLRRGVAAKDDQIKSKLEAILRKNRELFSESFVAIRNGRYTLPVKKECRTRIEGALVELSNSGGTCFIEPASVRKIQDELNELRIEEDNEVRRILYYLSALIYDNLPVIRINIEAMETLDFVFAKAKLSVKMKASPIRLTEAREMRVLSARHPLLRREEAVPLDFMLGGDIAGVVVTGPNTGGKTVALKTVGLVALMAQGGLHVPADGLSSTCVFDKIMCDIGDGQSITENLSTFSSHMTNIIGILKDTTENSLILLDELGSGTDPAEGLGIAMAILEELLVKGCLFAATTHYPEIKEFAAVTYGLINARMAFDRESLMPLYKLEIGEAGESCALFIAERLGLPAHLLERARAISYAGMERQADNVDVAVNAGGGGALVGGETLVCGEALVSGDGARIDGGEVLVDGNGATVSGGGARKSGVFLEIKPLDIVEEAEVPVIIPRSQRFAVGDSVTVYPNKEIGIVYARANEKGEIGVQIKKKKMLINHKRLKIKVAAAELYPDDYDFSIVFDSVADRKARHLMGKRHVEGNVVTIDEKQV